MAKWTFFWWYSHKWYIHLIIPPIILYKLLLFFVETYRARFIVSYQREVCNFYAVTLSQLSIILLFGSPQSITSIRYNFIFLLSSLNCGYLIVALINNSSGVFFCKYKTNFRCTKSISSDEFFLISYKELIIL